MESESRREPTKDTFISVLPEDLQSKICEVILSQPEPKLWLACNEHKKKSEHPFTNAINFSELCHRKQDIVLQATSGALTLRNRVNNQPEPDLRPLLCRKILQLDLSLRKQDLPLEGMNTDCIQSISIRSASNHLAFASYLKPNTLAKLSIRVLHNTKWSDIIKLIRRHQLQELTLDWTAYREIFDVSSSLEMILLAGACKYVKKLAIMKNHTLRLDLKIWLMILRMPALESLTYEGKPPIEVIPFLQKLKEVNICANTSLETAAQIGTCMRTICQLTSATVDSIQRCLLSCPQVRYLSICIANGAEKGLVEVVKNLEVLFLEWNIDSKKRDVNGWMRFGHEYIIDGEALLTIVKKCTNLKKLGLRYARTPARTIREILKSYGHRIESLSAVVAAEPNMVAERITCLLEDAARFCTKLKIFHLQGPSIYDTCRGTATHKARRGLALRVIKRRCPGFVTPAYWYVEPS